ncbi:dihydrodipicolinate synthase family protein [Jiangella gansuensis]|uniref:dihydrodipicolinate synthase family protein n=1 Tax=Jiangella gansuensis TaxID=281473 RepID=UPI0004B72098|nr:dihydrodipicolinate synthase family protein [Jiangella gansuensis]
MTTLNHAAGSSAMTLLTAVFTPFGPDGSLALGVVGDQADTLADWGSRGVYVGGTAGEGASMTTAERMALLERWCEVAAGRFDVIAHVGHTSLAEARNLAAHARDAGVQAISAVPPYFHRPADAAAVADFFAQVTQAAPDVPFIYYHIPGVTGVTVPASEVLVAARERVPTFAGIKFAHDDLADLQRCLHLAGDSHEMYVGSARLLLATMGIGARAAIGSAYNFAAPVFLRMIEHVAHGELSEARSCQLLAQSAIDTASAYGGELAGFKAAANLVGPDCGPTRPPLRSPGPAQVAELRDRLDALGLLAPASSR